MENKKKLKEELNKIYKELIENINIEIRNNNKNEMSEIDKKFQNLLKRIDYTRIEKSEIILKFPKDKYKKDDEDEDEEEEDEKEDEDKEEEDEDKEEEEDEEEEEHYSGYDEEFENDIKKINGAEPKETDIKKFFNYYQNVIDGLKISDISKKDIKKEIIECLKKKNINYEKAINKFNKLKDKILKKKKFKKNN